MDVLKADGYRTLLDAVFRLHQILGDDLESQTEANL